MFRRLKLFRQIPEFSPLTFSPSSFISFPAWPRKASKLSCTVHVIACGLLTESFSHVLPDRLRAALAIARWINHRKPSDRGAPSLSSSRSARKHECIMTASPDSKPVRVPHLSIRWAVQCPRTCTCPPLCIDVHPAFQPPTATVAWIVY